MVKSKVNRKGEAESVLKKVHWLKKTLIKLKQILFPRHLVHLLPELDKIYILVQIHTIKIKLNIEIRLILNLSIHAITL